MESGRFSQSSAFLKRAGHNVEETTFYTATAILHCTFYPALLLLLLYLFTAYSRPSFTNLTWDMNHIG